MNRETLGRKYPFEERNSILFQIISHPLRAVCNVYVANKGFLLFPHIYNGRQMIAVTIQPHSATICTQGCTLIFTILLKQVIAHENFIVIIFQSFCGLKQRGRKDDLIEQIPFAAIEQSAHSLIFQRHPPGL